MAFSIGVVLVGTGTVALTGALANTGVTLTNAGGTTALIGVGTTTGSLTAAPLPSGAVLPLGQLTGGPLLACTASGTATVGVFLNRGDN